MAQHCCRRLALIFLATGLVLAAPGLAADPSGGSYTLTSLVPASMGSATPSTAAGFSLRSSMPHNSGARVLTGGAFSFSSGFVPQTLIKFATTNVGSAHAYPVPWRKLLHEGLPIVFTDLPTMANIKIYTISGKLVRELTKNDPGSEVFWDMRNAQGQQVFSGVYFFLVRNPLSGDVRQGKLMIIR